jgi:phosphoribosylformylglycinamidine synthase PurS subunit
MPRIVVDVMPKPEILDPQGTAITHALGRLGFGGLGEVRQGKRFEVTVDSADEATLDKVREVAATLLSNPVIEDVVAVTVAPEDQAGEQTGDQARDGAAAGEGAAT